MNTRMQTVEIVWTEVSRHRATVNVALPESIWRVWIWRGPV
ncbi:hypothetical protein AB4Z09_14770 [Rhodococcus sp. TAF43]|nr:hypothetical protein [Rhodococcus sp. W8901]